MLLFDAHFGCKIKCLNKSNNEFVFYNIYFLLWIISYRKIGPQLQMHYKGLSSFAGYLKILILYIILIYSILFTLLLFPALTINAREQAGSENTIYSPALYH
jgi:hypothetical protein